MADLNEGIISQNISDPEFLSYAFDKILDQGIFGLGYGILLQPPTSFGPTGASFSPQEIMVVMPEGRTGEPHPLDALRTMLKGGAHRSNTHKDYHNGNQVDGNYSIGLILAYNPSAPSLYLFAQDAQIGWKDIKVFKAKPDDIVKEIGIRLATKNPIEITRPVKDPLDGFRDTSIRLIYIMSKSPYPAAINYQEV